MKCANCSAEIKDGSIYCPICGKEAQMINEYSSIEDEFLHSLVREGVKNTNETEMKKTNQTVQKHPKKQKSKTPVLVFTVCCLLLFLLIGKIWIDYKNHHSYDYQLQKARIEKTEHNYESALQYYERALAIVPTDLVSRMELAEIYVLKEEYDAAVILLQEVVQLDRTYKAAYEELITIYVKNEQYDQLKSLAEYTNNKEILKLFEGYLIEAPVIYPNSGKHTSGIKVTIISIDESPIYYTIDGSNPITNGERYLSEIPLKRSGFYTVRAVCKNTKTNLYSEITESKFQLLVMPPSVPIVSLRGTVGLTEPTYLTLTAEEECTLYYTWDGSMPTEASQKYTEPILVPEGNNILSVIAIHDFTGLASPVCRENYVYTP